MKTIQARRHSARLKMLWLTALLSAAAMVTACGGGGSTASVGSGGTGASFSGPVSGFGSVIVTGVRLNTSNATVTLDDDTSATENDLRLGMMIDVDGSRNDDGVTGSAKSISSHSAVQGPVTNTTGTQLTVLGLTVTVKPGTVFDGVAGLAGLASGDVVEVHGIPDGADGLTATRIELKPAATTEVRLSGAVQAGSLDTTNKTFRLHGTVVNYANAINSPTITEGLTVSVKGTLATVPTAVPATINATKIHVRNLDNLKKTGQLLELEGIVTTFASATDFEVNGNKVSVAATATVQGTVAAGSRVEVEGTVDASGALIATRVEVKNEDGVEANELHGLISAVDLSAGTFTLRGVPVTFNSKTVFEGLITSSLKDGITVEVQGTVTVTPTGSAVLATTIKLED